MKPLLGIVAVVAVAGAGWYVLTETDDVESGSSETLGPRAVVDGNGAGGAETPNPAKHAPTPVASKPDERTLWRKLRPATEQLVPDPDKVGPCPPESSGGLGRPVVRRFIDRTTGCPTWIHDDVNQRWSRLVSSDRAGSDVHIFPTGDLVSHLCWRNADELLVYCGLRDGRSRYVLFDDRDPDGFQVVGEGQLADDGHPSCSPDGRWFVTDTYADRLRRQHLILYDIAGERRYDLARLKTYRRFASPSLYQHWACDLHPRFDRSGRYVCFDAAFTGTRSLCTMDLGDALQHPETLRAI